MAACDVIIKDRSLAAWTVLDNAYTKTAAERTAPADQWLWHGVWIQLGTFETLNQQAPRDFDKIKIRHAGGDVEITKDAFVDNQMWINIIARNARPGAPMEVGYGYQLIPTDDRALHQYFHPYPGVITLWTESGYELDANPTDRASTRHSHEFKTNANDKVTVEVYHKGALAATYADVGTVEISDSGDLPPGNLKGPPA
ncbi:MAG: hypothetical protein R3344_04990 [Acidobacteriota bacterium]|nr:hypothetical protein [Acidobacteriota bacterium]